MQSAVSGFPRLETVPPLVSFAKTPWGRMFLVALFSALAWRRGLPAVPLGLSLAALSLWPEQRRALVAGATAYWLLAFGGVAASWAPLLVVFLGAWFGLALFQHKTDHWVFRRPVRNLLALYVALLTAVSYLPLTPLLRVSLWAVLAVAGKYLWFLCYALSDRKGVKQRPPLLTLFRFQPFWGGSNVPFPKGEANLDRIEAKNADELALCQLRGIELMVWSMFLAAALGLFDQTLQGPWPYDGWLRRMHLPNHIMQLNPAIELYLKGKPLPRLDCWLAVVANFSRKMLWVSAWGGSVIATCRMAGFNAVRNTRQPLSSRTIAEFYNRLYYYFKELLVDFFFYPTYFRYFKARPRLRVFAATLAAAGFGNALFHFLRDIDFIIEKGLWQALIGFQVYATYTLILGAGIAVSQMRSLSGHARGGRFTGPLCVLTFYCVLMILDDPRRDWTVRDYSSFVINLFAPFPR
jgi:Ca2+/Na+ antiporter